MASYFALTTSTITVSRRMHSLDHTPVKNARLLRPGSLGFTIAILFVSTMSNVGRTQESDQLPTAVRSWIQAVDPAIRNYSVVGYEAIAHNYTSRIAHRVKLYDIDAHEPKSFVFDEQGHLLHDGGRALHAQEAERRFELMGALTVETWDVALQTPDDVPIPVVLWLRTYEPSPGKEYLLADPDMAARIRDANARARVIAAESLEADWGEMITNTAATVLFDPDAPVAYTELEPRDLYSIADHFAVAAIYLNEAPTPAGTTYVNTVKANVQSYDGVNKKVCRERCQEDPSSGAHVRGSDARKIPHQALT